MPANSSHDIATQTSFNTLQEKMTPLDSGSGNPVDIVDLLRELFFSQQDNHEAQERSFQALRVQGCDQIGGGRGIGQRKTSNALIVLSHAMKEAEEAVGLQSDDFGMVV